MTTLANTEGAAAWHRVVLWAGIPLVIGALNEFALIVALPTIRTEFGLGVGDARWLVLAFLIADAVVLIAAGRYGDRVGRRRTAMLGLAVIAAGSLGCALVDSFSLLLVFRVVEGVGVGILFSGLLAIITDSAPRDSIGRAFGLWAMIGAVAILVSPVLGGVLAEYASWRWILVLNAALSLAALLIAGRLLPPMKVDPVGTQSTVKLVRVPNYAAGTGVISFIYLAVALTWLPLVFLLSLVSEISPTEVGLMFLAYSLWWLVLPPFTGRLADRVGVRRPMVAGLLVSALGLAILSLASDGSSLLMIAVGLSALAIGVSFAIPATNAAAMGQVPPETRGDASGVNMTARIIGSCLGLLIAGFLLAARATEAIQFGARWSWGAAAVTLVVAAVLAATVVREAPDQP